MQYFRTAQLYFKNIINKFHIFAISEHCLFTEQLDLLKQCTDYRYNSTAVCSDDNPPILSGKRGHGGVAIFWDRSYNDYVEPLSGIDCDRIVGIKCNFPNLLSFFVLAVYLPSSNHDDEDFSEYFDLLWSLYDFLSTESLVVVMGDLNADMGNAIGNKSAREPSWHGEKLLEFVHYFNLFPVNLFQNCIGPLDTLFSTCGRFRSTIDYILLPNYWFEKTSNAKTFCLSVDNTSDHVPIQVDIDLPFASVLPLGGEVQQFTHIMKIQWNDCSCTEIDERYVSPLIAELNELDFSDSTSVEELTRNLTEAIVRHSTSLAPPPKRTNNKSKKSYFKLPDHVKMAKANHSTAFDAWKSNDFVNTGEIFYNYKSTRAVYRSELRNFLNEKSARKLNVFVMPLKPMKSYFGNLLNLNVHHHK